MKFERVEPINKIESNLFIRHKVENMKEGELTQRCVCCGEIINGYKPNAPYKKGSPAGYLYINKSGNSKMAVSESAIQLGICNEPKEFVDCSIINS